VRQPSPSHFHGVQFYGSDNRLFTTVAAFLGDGLTGGGPALIISSSAHSAEIVDRLRRLDIDVDRARGDGELTVLDAYEVLDLFMAGDHPDARAFDENVGRFVEQALGGRSHAVLRAYGEMVDILWKQGRQEAAIRLEILWNTLCSRFGFALLCGYSLGNFYKQAERFDEVSRLHTHVIHRSADFRLGPPRGVNTTTTEP
jgi:hypothetical protein